MERIQRQMSQPDSNDASICPVPAPSIGMVSGDHQISTAEALQHAHQIAAGLAARGIGAGDSVALLLRNDIVFVEASYGITALGAYTVPVNWHSTPEDIVYVLEDCGARLLIAHADLLAAVRPLLPADIKVLCVATPPEIQAAYRIHDDAAAVPADLDDYAGWLAAQPFDATFPAGQAPLSMIYTSGTTGRPKGVRRNPPTPGQHLAIEAVRTRLFGLRNGMRALVPGPLYHSAPNAYALRAGRVAEALILMPRFDAEETLRLIAAERIDTVLMVPTMFIRLLRLPQAVRERYDLSSLRFVVHAAAPCPPEIKRQMIDWFGPIIWEYYGGTETGALTLVSSEEWLRKPGTVGRPAPGADIRIADEADNELPRGEIGEIFSRVADTADFTYQNLPEKRAEVERDGYLTGGDLGYLDEDGYLFICDRKRDMVISGGVNIYPAEIEAVLQTLPGVQDCAVFGIPDPDFGESLIAAVELQPGVELDGEALKAALKGLVASYKMPKRIEIHPALPREDSGKIFKRRLRDPYWETAGRRI